MSIRVLAPHTVHGAAWTDAARLSDPFAGAAFYRGTTPDAPLVLGSFDPAPPFTLSTTRLRIRGRSRGLPTVLGVHVNGGVAAVPVTLTAVEADHVVPLPHPTVPSTVTVCPVGDDPARYDLVVTGVDLRIEEQETRWSAKVVTATDTVDHVDMLALVDEMTQLDQLCISAVEWAGRATGLGTLRPDFLSESLTSGRLSGAFLLRDRGRAAGVVWLKERDIAGELTADIGVWTLANWITPADRPTAVVTLGTVVARWARARRVVACRGSAPDQATRPTATSFREWSTFVGSTVDFDGGHRHRALMTDLIAFYAAAGF